MRYIPHCKSDIAAMLEKIGAESVESLFEQIPAPLRFTEDLDLPAPMSEAELTAHMTKLAGDPCHNRVSFLGGGMYQHHLSPVVDQLLLRSEFYTAYTPYQPEISQGTLQAIFEFQTMICRVFGMQTSNASMYDGATALVEGALMARRVTRRHRVVASAGLHPEYIETLRTYLNALDADNPDLTMVPLDPKTGQTDLNALKDACDDTTACILVGYPNFFGVVEPIDEIVSIAKTAGARTITSTTEPFAFGVLTPPGLLDVDIATGEGQALGNSMSFGGPGVGLFCIQGDKKLLRQMPGRLVGKTTDLNGKDGFVLTLSTREQHIRREKATSNICTNHGLCALAVGINLSLLGKEGFDQVSRSCLARAHYLQKGIEKMPNFDIRFSGPVFNEFAVQCKTRKAAAVLADMEKAGFLAGIDMGRFDDANDDTFLMAVTETTPREQLDGFLDALSKL